MALLEVHNITKDFGGLRANNDISFTMGKGEGGSSSSSDDGISTAVVGGGIGFVLILLVGICCINSDSKSTILVNRLICNRFSCGRTIYMVYC